MTPGKPFSPYRAFVGVFIPDVLIPFRGLNAAEKICLARLYRYCGKKNHCWPSQEELAEELGVEVRSVHTYLNHLAEQNFIEIEQRGLHQPNLYRVLAHPIFCDESDIPLTGNNLPVKTGTTYSDQDRQDSSGPTYRTEESQGEENQNRKIFTLSDLNLEDPIEVFVVNSTRRTLGIRIKPKRAKEQLDQGEAKHGREDFRRWWLNFLEHYRAHRKEIDSPVMYFLKNPEAWARESPDAEPPARAMQPVDPSQGFPGDGPLRVTLPPRDFLAEWNRNVPASVTALDTGKTATSNYNAAWADPEFHERFSEVCTISQKIRTLDPSSTWLDFYWVLRCKNGSSRRGWQRLLTDMRGMSEPVSRSGQSDQALVESSFEKAMSKIKSQKAEDEDDE